MNRLPSRWFTWNAKSYFLWNKNQNSVCCSCDWGLNIVLKLPTVRSAHEQRVAFRWTGTFKFLYHFYITICMQACIYGNSNGCASVVSRSRFITYRSQNRYMIQWADQLSYLHFGYLYVLTRSTCTFRLLVVFLLPDNILNVFSRIVTDRNLNLELRAKSCIS